MQSVSSRIWTRIAVSISYDDNHYSTGTSIKLEFLIDGRIASVGNVLIEIKQLISW